MKTAVVSRAWKGEVPYITSWVNYYLETLGFQKVIIIRCDEERFDFLKNKFGERIDLKDYPANDEQKIFTAISSFSIPRDFDFLLSCDIDEYLVLKEKKIQDFIYKNNADEYFFRWVLCCNTDSSKDDLRHNLKLGCSIGHGGKSMSRISKTSHIRNEHRFDMLDNCTSIEPDINTACMVHFCSRSIEDLLIRSLYQGIKIEQDRQKYLICLENPPKKFEQLPYRFKIAYFQKKLKKFFISCELPPLSVDLEKLNSLFSQIKSLNLDYKSLFEKEYSIDYALKMYPKIPLWRAVAVKSSYKIF